MADHPLSMFRRPSSSSRHPSVVACPSHECRVRREQEVKVYGGRFIASNGYYGTLSYTGSKHLLLGRCARCVGLSRNSCCALNRRRVGKRRKDSVVAR